MDKVIAKKTVNALIPEAEMGFAAKFILKTTGAKATDVVLKAAKKLMGGLWVGGTAIIQKKKLAFRPNWLNRAVHKADYAVEIPFEEISEINVRFGIATKIIDIITCEGKFSIRCYGAENIANKIREQKYISASA